MLNVALHNCKTATANVVNGTNGPFCAITVIDEDGTSLQLYFNDWESIKHISEVMNIAASGLANAIEEIDIAMEEADKAERRGVK